MGKISRTLHNRVVSTASLVVAVLLLAPSLEAQGTQSTLAPTYSTASIANTATNLPGFAPNTIVTIYGTNLSYDTASVVSSNGYLSTNLDGVTVFIGFQPAPIFYISPGQINFLIPANLTAGSTPMYVIRQGTAGPVVSLPLDATAPGLFQSQPNTVLGTHADNSPISASSPAKAGEVVILYAVGLGPTSPIQLDGSIPSRPAPVANLSSFNVLINGTPVNSAAIQYAGVTPGCAGLYQVNLLLPTPLPANPELRVAIGAQISPAGMILPTQ